MFLSKTWCHRINIPITHLEWKRHSQENVEQEKISIVTAYILIWFSDAYDEIASPPTLGCLPRIEKHFDSDGTCTPIFSFGDDGRDCGHSEEFPISIDASFDIDD